MADIAILVDKSTSIGSENYEVMKEFIQKIVSELNVAPDGIHVALTTFATTAYPGFDFNAAQNSSIIKEFVGKMIYTTTPGTDVKAGLQYVLDNIFVERNGNRVNGTDILLLVCKQNMNLMMCYDTYYTIHMSMFGIKNGASSRTSLSVIKKKLRINYH